jgi:hypothetical protein
MFVDMGSDFFLKKLDIILSEKPGKRSQRVKCECIDMLIPMERFQRFLLGDPNHSGATSKSPSCPIIFV